mgnify:CR=1 FL=1
MLVRNGIYGLVSREQSGTRVANRDEFPKKSYEKVNENLTF